MHWIGAQFCLCVFLDSIDNSVKLLKFDLVTESAYNSQNTQFGIVMSFFNLFCSPRKIKYHI